jgi:apolipoprotein N-acyltransferase
VRSVQRNSWLLAILSAVLQILIFPLPHLYVLCWVALAPLIVAVLHARPAATLQLPDSSGAKRVSATFGQGFLLAYVSGILWYGGTCYWVFDVMHQYGGLSTPAAIAILVLFCLYLAIYHGLFGALLGALASPGQRFSSRAVVIAPFLWVAMELARTRITGFPWDLLGTVQVDNVPLARIATVAGVYGLSFEIVLVNTAFAAAFLLRRERRNTLLMAALAAAFFLQFGRWMNPAPLPADRAAVLVQSNVPILDSAEWTKDYFEATLRELSALSEQPPAPHQPRPTLIAWPESPTPFYTSDPLFRQAVSDLAQRTKASVLVGSLGVRNASQSPSQASEVFNSGALVSPSGEWVARYDKVHLVPFGEFVPFKSLFSFASGLTKEVGEFGRGTSRQPLPAGDARLGVFICYESVFPDEIRQFARDGAEVFVNLSNDGWYGDSGAYAQHLLQARMRAVENERWLLRDTNTGVTASIDPYGRVVASLPRKRRIALSAPYSLTHVTTFYTRHGDWFAYLCAIISLGALLARFLLRTTTGRQ